MPPPHLGGYGQPAYPPPGSYPPPGGYPPPPGAYGPPPSKPPVSALAISSLITGLVLPIIGMLIAVPMAIIALVRISKGKVTGKKMAIGGIVAAVAWVVAFVAWGVYIDTQQAERDDAGVIIAKGNLSYGEIETGDCVIIPNLGGTGETNPDELTGVPCDETHNVQAIGAFEYDEDDADFPGRDTLGDDSAPYCNREARSYQAALPDLVSYRLIPDEDVWDSEGGDRVVCFIANADFDDLTTDLTE